MPVAPVAAMPARVLNRSAFAAQPAPVNFGAGSIWGPLVYCFVAIFCGLINPSMFGWICAGIALTVGIFSAVSLQVRAVPVLAKVARWSCFAWLAFVPILAAFGPIELFEFDTPIIELYEYVDEGAATLICNIAYVAQIMFAFAGVGAYFKRCMQSTSAITQLRVSSITGAIVGLSFITLAAANGLPIATYFLFESTMVLQPIGFILVWLVPVLHITLPEKHIPNVIWLILKIFAIIMVVFFGIILFDCVIYMITDESFTNVADYSMLYEAFYSFEIQVEEITYFPYFYYVLSQLIIEFLYFTAMIFNIDISHSNIFKKSR